MEIESIYSEKMDKQDQEGLDAFKKTVDVIITNQTKMIDMVIQAEEMLKQHTVDFIVTKEFNDKLHQMFNQFMHLVAENMMCKFKHRKYVSNCFVSSSPISLFDISNHG